MSHTPDRSGTHSICLPDRQNTQMTVTEMGQFAANAIKSPLFWGVDACRHLKIGRVAATTVQETQAHRTTPWFDALYTRKTHTSRVIC